MRYLSILLLLFLAACGQNKKYHDKQKDSKSTLSAETKAIIAFQQKLNKTYKSPETSPLPDRYRKSFESLDFFKPDTNYIIKTRFERTPNATPFLLKTTTGETTEEVLYGIAHFELNGSKHQLEVYQSLDLMGQEAYKDYLFLPFLDKTNGDETYGGGRYIDLSIPDNDTLVIDFNRAYNPYCVYNKKYSCPLVPRQNYLDTKVLAGVKDFEKNN